MLRINNIPLLEKKNTFARSVWSPNTCHRVSFSGRRNMRAASLNSIAATGEVVLRSQINPRSGKWNAQSVCQSL